MPVIRAKLPQSSDINTGLAGKAFEADFISSSYRSGVEIPPWVLIREQFFAFKNLHENYYTIS